MNTMSYEYDNAEFEVDYIDGKPYVRFIGFDDAISKLEDIFKDEIPNYLPDELFEVD